MNMKGVGVHRLVFALIFFLLSLPNIVFAEKGESSLKITDPARDNVEVGKGMEVNGLASLQPGQHVWVLIRRSDFKGVWWPQGEGGVDPQKHDWKVPVIFGGIQDIGWDFDIAALVVDEKSNMVLQRYRIDAIKSGDWRPIEAPPSVCPPQTRTVKKVSHD